jgi:hypothetical protein
MTLTTLTPFPILILRDNMEILYANNMAYLGMRFLWSNFWHC